MGRKIEEFMCSESGGGCGGSFLTYLRDNVSGEFTVECPACGHHHFRRIEYGHVKDTRHSHRDGTTEIIIGLKTTFRKKGTMPHHEDPDWKRRQMRLLPG